jgi:hypothetical protein
MKTTYRSMTQPQGTAHAEHAFPQLAARFEDWRHRCTSPSDPIPVLQRQEAGQSAP